MEIFLRGETMLEITKLATNKLNEYFKGKERKPIRIFLNAGG
jgi:Fe-S cluster assembly iron-binding protein IscA